MENYDFEGTGLGERARRNSWLIYILIFSLALNLAAGASLVCLRHLKGRAAGRPQAESPLTVNDLCRSLGLQVEQCRQMHRLARDRRKQRQDLRERLAQQQRELWNLVKQDSPFWGGIQSKIRDIISLQTKMEEEAVQLCLEFERLLQPEQRVVYLTLLEKMLRPERDGSGGSSAFKPGGGHWGNARKTNHSEGY